MACGYCRDEQSALRLKKVTEMAGGNKVTISLTAEDRARLERVALWTQAWREYMESDEFLNKITDEVIKREAIRRRRMGRLT